MKNLRQVFLGILIALASFGLILGGFSLSLSEANIVPNPAPTFTLTPSNSPTLKPFTLLVISPTLPATLTPAVNLILTPTWTPSLPPSPTNCPPSPGWSPYVVQVGDMLDNIATRYGISVAALQQANCLLTTELLPGSVIYVPPVPTQTPLPCGRPYGWIAFTVQPGDTLYRLSLAYGISVGELQKANCLGNSTLLRVGQILYVPPWATHTPSPTFPAPLTPTAIPTVTPELGPPSETPTEAPTSTPTESPFPTASDTPTEAPTDTLTPE